MSANLAQLLVRSAHAYPRLPALAYGARVSCSYAELAARVARMAAGLAQRLRPNDRVALMMKNCPQYVELLFACWHAGLCAVPVNAKLHPRELEFILQNSGARLCFASAELVDALGPLSCTTQPPPPPNSNTPPNPRGGGVVCPARPSPPRGRRSPPAWTASTR